MRNLGLNELRKEFLDFFKANSHYVRESFPLVPINDKSLLLVNAGMQPLKSYFTGEEIPPSTRMATCQKCMRTVDVSNVGYTKRHATMFEMLGNFSFGDYFKKESLTLGWKFCTEVLEMDPEKLWPTIYEDDDEAFEIWHKEIGLSPERIVRLGKDTNFWEIGTGPCGPCSEIHYDRGIEHGCNDPNCKPGCDCDRWLEFWNHVFTQFNRDEEGNYSPLKSKNIDTGMGLERLACLVQGVDSIFDIDVISRILSEVKNRSTHDCSTGENLAFAKIITDHIKAVTFLVGDGVIPSNEGRGYVLRRILRRAARFATKLGIKISDFVSLSSVVIRAYESGYPVLAEKEEYILKVVSTEAERFSQTIDSGLEMLSQHISELKSEQKTILSGQTAFKLYDTFGFPIELTEEILSEEGMTLDKDEFSKEMALQKERARNARKDLGWSTSESGVPEFDTKFVGYNEYSASSKVLFIDGADLIVESTPFYPEGGGQVGDKGKVFSDTFRADVQTTIKSPKGTIIHKLSNIEGEVSEGDILNLQIDVELRRHTTRNHSATHLLHKALRKHLGLHVEQAGSQVTPEKLRFDFTHFESISKDVLQAIEREVNEEVLKSSEIKWEYMPLNEAKAKGAMALFGEKYGDIARVVEMGDYSIELCGGTHLSNTAEVGLFKILSESGISAGTRRIEAITGSLVYDYLLELEQRQKAVCETLKSTPLELLDKVSQTVAQLKDSQKEVKELKEKIALSSLDQILGSAQTVGDYTFVSGVLPPESVDSLKNFGDRVLDVHKDAVVLLFAKGEKVPVLVMLGKKPIDAGLKAGDLVKAVTSIIGGGGGGRPNMAMASGHDQSKIAAAIEHIKSLLA